MVLSLLLTISIIYTFSTTLFLLLVPILAISFKFYLSTRDQIKNENIINKTNYLKEANNKIIKISSIFDGTVKEMISYFNNYRTYRDWNKYIKEIPTINKDENTTKLIFIKENGVFDLNIKRRVYNSTNYSTIAEFSEIDNIPSIIKFILIENSLKADDKCKVTMFIPLNHFKYNDLHLNFLRSSLKALDLLHFSIQNKNFIPEQEDCLNNKNESSKHSKKPSLISFRSLAKKALEEVKEDIKEETIVENVVKETPQGRVSIPIEERLSNAESTYSTPNIVIEITEEIKPTAEEDKPTLEEIKPVIEEIVPIVEEIKPSIEEIKHIYSQEDQELVEISNLKRAELDGFMNRDWKILEEKSDYKLFYLDEKNGLRAIKSEVFINANIDTCWNLLNDLNLKGKYDKNFDTGYCVRDIDENYKIFYNKYKGKLGISPRDFVMICYYSFTPDEGIIVATSIPTATAEKIVPKDKKNERADLKVNKIF